jgi:hypothetical protein
MLYLVVCYSSAALIAAARSSRVMSASERERAVNVSHFDKTTSSPAILLWSVVIGRAMCVEFSMGFSFSFFVFLFLFKATTINPKMTKYHPMPTPEKPPNQLQTIARLHQAGLMCTHKSAFFSPLDAVIDCFRLHRDVDFSSFFPLSRCRCRSHTPKTRERFLTHPSLPCLHVCVGERRKKEVDGDVGGVLRWVVVV